MTYKPPTIDEVGIKKWVDNGREDQNDRGWLELSIMVGDDPKKPVTPVARIAKAFNKDPRTIADWLERMAKVKK